MSDKLWDFHGGIHPPENKTQSTQVPITTAPLPARLVIPLQQHIGQPAEPLVEIGDKVLKGQMICAANGYVSVAVHAPTSGTVVAITEHTVPHPSGLPDLCVIMDTDGREQWAERSPTPDYRDLERTELLDIIANAGIAGLGGAGFPAAVKLNPSQEVSIDILVINGAECEPYITADDMLMQERAAEIIQGIEIVIQLLGVKRCLIGIEANKPQAIAALEKYLLEHQLQQQIELVTIPVKYPSGGEKQLIRILTGREVPSGGIPADIGILCHNPGTCAAIYRAVVLGEPLISRIVTLTGAALASPGNLEVLFGTPVSELLAHCQLQEDKLDRLLMGGPMMGVALEDPSLPIVKTTNCIVASTRDELPQSGPEQACIRCGMCAEVCPATLLPQQLYWYAKSKEFDKALEHNLLDCIECGACSYVCPSNIPLVQYYRYAKGEIRAQEHEHTRSEHSRQRFEARKARQDQEAAEKEARRTQRAEAAATKKRSQSGATTDDAAATKAAVIQAALERAQAKKAGQQATAQDPGARDLKTTKPQPKQTEEPAGE